MHCVRRTMDQDVSAQLCLLACFILTVDLTLGLGSNQDMQFTFLLPAGSTECFYQTTMSNDSMEVEYQVIAGSGLDVGFALISPSGHRLVSDFRKSDGMHMVDPTEDGDYRLCFDNSFSKLSEKMVFFEARMEFVYQQLERSRQVQTVLRAFEARDRYLLEDNLWRVSFWSCLNLLVMLTVAVTQIYTLRRLFDDTKRTRT
ncbi:transmembrane emp24 domain-containing protein 1-like isoform X2 [Seriola dumerili]|uniref:transmembrane emp24 domain-containing protein 1-like isoform X2 n=1 Tax=Seriola dumerili TaxID=41447 RepID=UPI000BBE3AD1|nr:transmembrane emp24 domain-containing protein 1-like isoform X2 [Seriola dumerili]